VKPENVFFLPISALHGIGIFKGGQTFPFFEGITPAVKKPGFEKITTLEEAIDYQDVPTRALNKPLRLPIASIAHVPGHGVIFCGRVECGQFKKTDWVRFLPVNLKAEVKNVQAHRKDLEVAEAGMNIGFNIITKEKAATDKIAAGHMVGPADDAKFQLYPFYVISGVSLKGKTKGGADEKGIKAGYTPVFACGTSNIAGKFIKLLTAINKDNVTIENPDLISKDQRFTALVYPTKQALYETYADFPTLGKYVCRDSGQLVVVGQIAKCVTEEEALKDYGVKLSDVAGGKPASVAVPAAEKRKK